MGATNTSFVKQPSAGLEETQARLNLAREILLSRTIAEPWAFGAVADLLHREMFSENLAWGQGIMLAAIELHKKEGQYTTLSLSRKSGNEAYALQIQAANHPETTLSEAVENFIHCYGRSVEMKIALNILSGGYAEEDSFGVQAKADAFRKEQGVYPMRPQDESVEIADAEFKMHIDGEEIQYPVRPFLSGLRTSIGHYTHGDFIVVGAVRGVGKSFFSLGQAKYCAEGGVKSLIINLEMPEGEVRQRLFQMRNGNAFGPGLSRLPQDEMRKAMLDWDWAKTTKDVQIINPGRDLSAIARAMRQAKAEGCGFIAIDYVQLMRDSTQKNRGRHDELGSIVADLRALQLEMKIPVMVMAQGNRESQKTGNKRMYLDQFGEGTALENAATLAHIIYRPMALSPPVTHDEEGVPYSENYADITNAKGRNRGLAFVKCEFDWRRGFTDISAQPLQPPNYPPAQDFSERVIASARPMGEDDIPF